MAKNLIHVTEMPSSSCLLVQPIFLRFLFSPYHRFSFSPLELRAGLTLLDDTIHMNGLSRLRRMRLLFSSPGGDCGSDLFSPSYLKRDIILFIYFFLLLLSLFFYIFCSSFCLFVCLFKTLPRWGVVKGTWDHSLDFFVLLFCCFVFVFVQ